jgi:ribosomal protein S18 acetylase RimI-like enzyme
MNPVITVRPATTEDAELIADLSRATFYETFASQNTPADMDKFMQTQFAKDKLMEELNEPENLFFLAYNEDQVAGYLKLGDGKNPQQLQKVSAIEIVRLYSITSMIGKGIGRALMQTSIDIAIERNKHIIWLGVWERNQRAIDFYQKWGFEKFAEHDFILGNDIQTDWLMKKHLKV